MDRCLYQWTIKLHYWCSSRLHTKLKWIRYQWSFPGFTDELLPMSKQSCRAKDCCYWSEKSSSKSCTCCPWNLSNYRQSINPLANGNFDFQYHSKSRIRCQFDYQFNWSLKTDAFDQESNNYSRLGSLLDV